MMHLVRWAPTRGNLCCNTFGSFFGAPPDSLFKLQPSMRYNQALGAGILLDSFIHKPHHLLGSRADTYHPILVFKNLTHEQNDSGHRLGSCLEIPQVQGGVWFSWVPPTFKEDLWFLLCYSGADPLCPWNSISRGRLRLPQEWVICENCSPTSAKVRGEDPSHNALPAKKHSFAGTIHLIYSTFQVLYILACHHVPLSSFSISCHCFPP